MKYGYHEIAHRIQSAIYKYQYAVEYLKNLEEFPASGKLKVVPIEDELLFNEIGNPQIIDMVPHIKNVLLMRAIQHVQITEDRLKDMGIDLARIDDYIKEKGKHE